MPHARRSASRVGGRSQDRLESTLQLRGWHLQEGSEKVPRGFAEGSWEGPLQQRGGERRLSGGREEVDCPKGAYRVRRPA